MSQEYMVKINDGDPVKFVSKFTVYSHAALDAFGRMGCDYPCEIEIWVPRLLPEYGPYRFSISDFIDIEGNQYNCPAVMDID